MLHRTGRPDNILKVKRAAFKGGVRADARHCLKAGPDIHMFRILREWVPWTRCLVPSLSCLLCLVATCLVPGDQLSLLHVDQNMGPDYGVVHEILKSQN
jgi:hypothetical protein